MAIEKLSTPPNSSWGEVVVLYTDEESGQQKKYHFPCHIPTGEVFNLDPDLLIRTKCLGLSFLTPLITIVRVIYALTAAIFLSLREIYHYMDGQEITDEAKEAIIRNSQDWIRAFGYGIVLTGCAILGTIDPFRARSEYSYYERMLNRHPDGPHRDKFYLAICFQRLCIIDQNDPTHDQKTDLKLTKYIVLINGIFHAVLSGSIQHFMAELRTLGVT